MAKKAKVTLTINGQEVKADPKATVLDAARSIGLERSNLHRKIKSYGLDEKKDQNE